MITLKSELEIIQYLDELSFQSIIETMEQDCPSYAERINAKENESIGRCLCKAGSDHTGSMMPFGYLLRYLFRKNLEGYDYGIKDLKIPESTDEFLDLFNEIKKNPDVFNVIYEGK